MLAGKRIVDLTRLLTPDAEAFKLSIQTFFVDELLPGFSRPKDEWYIMQEWLISSHIGTHIESPYHHIENGIDVSKLPIENLMGEAILLDLRNKKPGEAIQPEELRKAGPDLRNGDIVLVHTGFDRNYGKKNYNRPYLSLASLEWLVERKIVCLGIDASGIERYKAQSQPGHILLFEHGIPIIEELTNLGSITQQRFFFIALPIPIVKADSCPVRAVAIEEV